MKKSQSIAEKVGRIAFFGAGFLISCRAVYFGLLFSDYPGQIASSLLALLFGISMCIVAIIYGRLWNRWIELQERKLEKKLGKKEYRELRNNPSVNNASTELFDDGKDR